MAKCSCSFCIQRSKSKFDSLGQGWRTFFGERAKILKMKFSKLMPCHYIERTEEKMVQRT